MCKIDGRMDDELYTSILQDDFLKTVEFYGLDRENLIFQQDNNPKHTSHKASKWFKQNHINVLKWPAQSHQQKGIKLCKLQSTPEFPKFNYFLSKNTVQNPVSIQSLRSTLLYTRRDACDT